MGCGHDEPLVDDGATAEDKVDAPWPDEGHLPGVLILIGRLTTDNVLEAATGSTLKPTLAICERINRKI